MKKLKEKIKFRKAVFIFLMILLAFILLASCSRQEKQSFENYLKWADKKEKPSFLLYVVKECNVYPENGKNPARYNGMYKSHHIETVSLNAKQIKDYLNGDRSIRDNEKVLSVFVYNRLVKNEPNPTIEKYKLWLDCKTCKKYDLKKYDLKNIPEGGYHLN